ncbi:MAG TPA: pitrilysin family protein [Verrucomicrobiota bacterium]|nr:insulinase family protein [Verrucomicrobiales bacterium]HRI11984.1 pitrilysin family protein [Verrucomicrobiota bacterium]
MKFACLLLATALALGSAVAQQIPVIEKRLPNGFKLLMVERHEEPRIAGGWVVKVGSANERLGITGIAHLFEHMMFKGTPTLGTKDAKRDLELIAEQERVRDLMRQEEANLRASSRRGEVGDVTKQENFTPRYRELEADFKKLMDEQRQLLVKNEFDRVYTIAGASGMNAFTSEDMTGYFITVPANKLELWCWMESERLLRPVFREFYAERDVVYEERRMRVESTPIGKFGEEFNAMFWIAHPYMWPVLGWPSDIPNISKKDADIFYALYYQPQNITLILVGDFKPDEAEAMVQRYFGRIPAGTQPPPEVTTQEPPQLAEKRMYAEAETNPQVDILWKTVGFQHHDSYPLDILQLLLSNRTGRLYKGLVLGREVATETYAQQDSRKWAGLFNIGGEAKDGKTPEEVEAAIYAELERLKTEPVPDEELQKVKNQFAALEYRKLTTNLAIFFQVLQNEGLGDWREVNESNAKLQAVTAADVQRVANTYFTKEARAVAIYTRKPGTGASGDDPDLAQLSAEQRPVIRRIVDALNSESDASKLKQQLAQMEAQAGQGDPKRQQLQKLIQKKVAERIAELEKK